MSSRGQKLLARVNWYFRSSLKHITEYITGNRFYYRGGRYRQVSLCCTGCLNHFQDCVMLSAEWYYCFGSHGHRSCRHFDSFRWDQWRKSWWKWHFYLNAVTMITKMQFIITTASTKLKGSILLSRRLSVRTSVRKDLNLNFGHFFLNL